VFFFKLGCVPVFPLQNTACVFRVNWYGNECQEILQSALRARYAVSTNTDMSNTARYSSGIAFFAYPTSVRCPRSGGSRRNIATPFAMEKLERCGYPTMKKCQRYVYSFWHDPRTWQTDTACQHRPRLCIASRGNNWHYCLIPRY